MKVQMRQPAGIPGVAAQANGLSSDDMVTNLDEGSTFGEVGVRGDGPIGVADFDPIGLTLSRLPIPKLHPYLGHHSCAILRASFSVSAHNPSFFSNALTRSNNFPNR